MKYKKERYACFFDEIYCAEIQYILRSTVSRITGIYVVCGKCEGEGEYRLATNWL